MKRIRIPSRWTERADAVPQPILPRILTWGGAQTIDKAEKLIDESAAELKRGHCTSEGKWEDPELEVEYESMRTTARLLRGIIR